jgi:hypothetical protein
VRDAGLARDVPDAALVEPFAREDAHRSVEDQPPLLLDSY